MNAGTNVAFSCIESGTLDLNLSKLEDIMYSRVLYESALKLLHLKKISQNLIFYCVLFLRETALYGNLILKKGVIPAELLQ